MSKGKSPSLVSKIKGIFVDQQMAEFEQMCRAVRKDGKGLFLWEEDDRFQAVLSIFPAADADSARAIIEKYFPYHWTSANIDQAPKEAMERIFRDLGPMDEGKELYHRDPDEDILKYIAWWPWEDEATITIRLGFVTRNILPTKEKKLFKAFHEWFGIFVTHNNRR